MLRVRSAISPRSLLHSASRLMIFTEIMTTPISMRERIAGDPLSCEPIDVLFALPAFLITSMDPDLVRRYRLIFEYGRAEYNYGIDSFMSHDELGDGEGAAYGLDREWFIPFQNCANATICQDEYDPSSPIRSQPGYTVLRNGAIVLKVICTGSQRCMAHGRAELTAKFHPTASDQFPSPHSSIFGVVSCPSKIEIYLLSFDRVRHVFISSLIPRGEFLLREVYSDRIRFIQVVFNILRWLSPINNSHREFHLTPGIRMRTPNGHYVTFNSEGILKEYRTINTRQITYMAAVYEAELPNIEWGRVVDVGERSVMITRIGTMLNRAIKERRITKQAAEDGVRAGINQLHSLGYAHCDIKLANVLIDSDNTVFVNDIEYLTPVTDTEWDRPFPNDRELPLTAGDLDDFQFNLFRCDLARI